MARSWNIIFFTVFATVNSVASTIMLHHIVSLSHLVNSPTCTNISQNVLLKDPQYAPLKDPQKDITSRIRLIMYTGSSIDTARTEVFAMHEIEKIYNAINLKQPLVLYIHGYVTKPSDDSVRTIVGAHLERGSDNIMLLDWSDIAFGLYPLVVGTVSKVATAAAQTFDTLFDKGLNLETFHCVGHSLGAQICGFLGKTSIKKIPRITGLDPAWPGFNLPSDEHIKSTDARFVDILHTDGGVYGAPNPTGTVDFFANSGSSPQPGCFGETTILSLKIRCSHSRAWQFYAESVLNTKAFLAVQCSSHIDYVLGNCDRNPTTHFGYATPATATGSFYFATGSTSPFSKNVLKMQSKNPTVFNHSRSLSSDNEICGLRILSHLKKEWLKVKQHLRG